MSSSVALGQAKIVEMSIACSNDHVYTWFSDQTVSVGTSENLAAYQPPHSYSLPFGKTPEDIVGIGIAGDDRVYTWYRDSTVSVGTSTDLDTYQPRHPYRAAKEESASRILAMDIACSNDHVYTWYSDHIVSAGTSDDLDKYNKRSHFTTGTTASSQRLVGIGIARNDHVYAWYSFGSVSSGTSENFDLYRRPYEYVVGPGPCNISADPPKFDGRLISSVGIRGPECKSSGGITVRLVAINSPVGKKVLATTTKTGSNFEASIFYQCLGNTNTELRVVTEVQNTSRTVTSKETLIQNCF
jgi:hypothetical protein